MLTQLSTHARCIACDGVVVVPKKYLEFFGRYVVTMYCSFCSDDIVIDQKEKELFVDHKKYIKSERWKMKSDIRKHESGFRCQVCNKGADKTILDAHHRTYDNLGWERKNDITILCRDCHSLYELKIKKQKTNIVLQQNSHTMFVFSMKEKSFDHLVSGTRVINAMRIIFAGGLYHEFAVLLDSCVSVFYKTELTDTMFVHLLFSVPISEVHKDKYAPIAKELMLGWYDKTRGENV